MIKGYPLEPGNHNYNLLIPFLKEQEGFSHTPYKAPEGNLTIGYGHVLTEDIGWISERSANCLLAFDISRAEEDAMAYVDRTYGYLVFDQLSSRYKQALMEMTFNLGSLQKFPKFTRAIIKGDKETALKECIRYYKDDSGRWRELERRNNAFINTFLK